MFLARNDTTEFAPDLTPEDLQEIMARLRTVIRRVLERHGGRVAQRLGPWHLVLFGFPVARDDAPDRAVTAAIEIRAGIEQRRRSCTALEWTARFVRAREHGYVRRVAEETCPRRRARVLGSLCARSGGARRRKCGV